MSIPVTDEAIINALNQTLTLWDGSDPPVSTGLVYCWNGYEERHPVHSLLRYAEIHGERLRHKYLAWIHELGESLIDGKKLIDHLALEDGLSYWWMTPWVEKSPWKSPAIIDAIRLFALEEIVVELRPVRLRLVSTNWRLQEAVASLCDRQGIDYERAKPTACSYSTIDRGYRALPPLLHAASALVRYWWVRRPLKNTEKRGWFDGSQARFFCSYYFNIAQGEAREGRFHSRYWLGLHQLLQGMGLHANWLQLYVPHADVPNPGAAISLIQGFNLNCQQEGFHAFLDAYLSWRVVLRVIRRWFRLTLISWRLGEIRYAFSLPASGASLWPFMQDDWRASMRGSFAISHLLWIELFDEALSDIPHQAQGFYLCENQAWERAFIHAWRKHGHGQLIAVAHSTVRFWDMRYFTDPRTLRDTGQLPLPQPDLVALNGKAAMDAYLGAGYPRDTIVECEALRYGHLGGSWKIRTPGKTRGDMVNVLILGDYISSGTIAMLRLLVAAAPQLSDKLACSYALKPHPNYPVRPADYASLHLKVVTEPLEEILHDYDIVYAGNMTSAAVEAYFVGLPVVVMLDRAGLNFSPLRGQPGVHFVSTPEELAVALLETRRGMVADVEQNEFFFLDAALPRWRRLLSSADSA